MKGILKSRRGNEFVEAAVAIPLITAAVLLILNLFVFYLNILATGVKGHKEALGFGPGSGDKSIPEERKRPDGAGGHSENAAGMPAGNSVL